MIMPETIEHLRLQARTYRELAEELEEKAFEKQQDRLNKLEQQKHDPLINKADAIELLWFGSYEALKQWEQKVQHLGYLRFENNKILRSEVLRFRDDYYNGIIKQKRNNQ